MYGAFVQKDEYKQHVKLNPLHMGHVHLATNTFNNECWTHLRHLEYIFKTCITLINVHSIIVTLRCVLQTPNSLSGMGSVNVMSLVRWHLLGQTLEPSALHCATLHIPYFWFCQCAIGAGVLSGCHGDYYMYLLFVKSRQGERQLHPRHISPSAQLRCLKANYCIHIHWRSKLQHECS